MARLALLLVLALAVGSLGIQIKLEDLFGGGGGFFGGAGGGGGGEEHEGHEEAHHEAEHVPGYPCKTGQLVERPQDCPCPMRKMTKCVLGDWYICVPSGSKCPYSSSSSSSHRVVDDEL
eukprot:m.235318 g.235318  ORF g.235318 m.235318 type:complete len:119 (-) comp12800_c0_seq1:57-413(-)